MPTSNKQVAAAVATLQRFFSKYTGADLEASIEEAKKIMPFIDQNIAVPAAAFTGDFNRVEITTLSRDMWLESITLVCKQAFSESSKEINYEISMNNGTLVSIPNDFMRDTGNVLTYHINKLIPVGTSIYMVCTSTRAYGEVTVKLNFQ